MTKKTLTNQKHADEPVIKSPANHTASTDAKVLLLAVSTRNGKLVISPLDLESEGDNQTPLSESEQQLFKENHAAFTKYQEGFEKGLNALHTIFAGRLPREKFASFENYCFALHDMSISEDKLTQLKVKANRLRLNGVRRKEVGV
jgi:hypothetical protein